MLGRRRKVQATLRYMRKPMIQFAPLAGLTALLVLAGGVAFQHLQPEDHLNFGSALYRTYTLIFMEPVTPFPDHWLLRIFCTVLPPLGLVVILDGIVRFSYHFLRRDDTSREWNRAMTETLDNHVILFGLGKVGMRVLQQLLKLGEHVVVVEKSPQCPNLAFARKHEVPCFIGSGREDGLLDDVCVKDAKSLICATDDDLANLELSLDARKINPRIRVVLRMFDQELASKVRESFDIQVAFSTAELSAPTFATASADPSIVNAFYVDDLLLVVANVEIARDSKLLGKTIRQLSRENPLVVVSMRRGGRSLLYPHDDAVFEIGDQIVLQTQPATLRQLHTLNGRSALTQIMPKVLATNGHG
ncbi:MAG: TrkA family potassium uptake protein [Planctomycetes bacterium]|nr:TrkA family potassium uptake protein [Planctomycetota bacterium]